MASQKQRSNKIHFLGYILPLLCMALISYFLLSLNRLDGLSPIEVGNIRFLEGPGKEYISFDIANHQNTDSKCVVLMDLPAQESLLSGNKTIPGIFSAQDKAIFDVGTIGRKQTKNYEYEVRMPDGNTEVILTAECTELKNQKDS